MALPVSWKPLVKSNARAVAIRITRMIVSVVTRIIVRSIKGIRLIFGPCPPKR